MSRHPHIGICALAYPGHVSRETSMALAGAEHSALSRGWRVSLDPVCIQPTDVARNSVLVWARTRECSHVLMVDADTWLEPGDDGLGVLFDELSSNDGTAIGAVCVMRGSNSVNASTYRPDATYRCDLVGAGILLIDVVALDRLCDGPWFSFTRSSDGSVVVCAEDIRFCLRVAELGGTMLATTKLRTRHGFSSEHRLEDYRVNSE